VCLVGAIYVLYLWRSAAGGTGEASVAVLPFDVLSSDSTTQFFAEGLSEELILYLSKIDGLRVPGRMSSFAWKGKQHSLQAIGAQLEVENIFSGSVRKENGRWRIIASLTPISGGASLWTDRYEVDDQHLFAVQDSLVLAIVRGLKVKLSPVHRALLMRRYTENTEAYEHYLRGRYYWNRRNKASIQKAMVSFQEALNKDSLYALAYAGLADCYNTIVFVSADNPWESHERARTAALKALELDSTLAEAHTSLAFVKERLEWDWEGAEAEYRKALELNPRYVLAHQWYGLYKVFMGRFDDGLAEIGEGLKLDPLSLQVRQELALALWHAGRNDEAIAQFRKNLELDSNYVLSRGFLARVYETKGMYSKALETTFGGTPPLPAVQQVLAQRRRELDSLGWKGYSRLRLNEWLARNASSFALAYAYAQAGDKEGCLRSLQQAFEEKFPTFIQVKTFPTFAFLHGDPRFEALLKKARLNE
jgi:TolB-like protein/tetratricopeptide (TPR) repeat protein